MDVVHLVHPEGDEHFKAPAAQFPNIRAEGVFPRFHPLAQRAPRRKFLQPAGVQHLLDAVGAHQDGGHAMGNGFRLPEDNFRRQVMAPEQVGAVVIDQQAPVVPPPIRGESRRARQSHAKDKRPRQNCASVHRTHPASIRQAIIA